MKNFWNNLYSRPVIDENLVSGIHMVELLEAQKALSINYFQRVNIALSYLPLKYKDAALAIFSNVVYLSKDILDQTYQYFWSQFLREQGIKLDQERIVEQCHFFEVDPSGMINDFMHFNNIQKRLNPDCFARLNDVKDVLQLLERLRHQDDNIFRDAYDNLKMLAYKKYWILLTDKVLSGQSLFTDIERYLQFREIIYRCFGRSPELHVFAQVFTNDAKQYEIHGRTLDDFEKVYIHYAIFFDEKMKINSDSCELFRGKELRDSTLELCEWFAENILSKDTRFNIMREKSRDNLAFGYRRCGLTLVDFDNCPANSLPILWYTSDTYVGPFPRVHSRLGTQIRQPSKDGWDKVNENFVEEIFAHLNKRTNDKRNQ